MREINIKLRSLSSSLSTSVYYKGGLKMFYQGSIYF